LITVANAFNSTATLTDLVETAYDRKVEWALRSMPQFRAIVDKKPEAQAMPGDVVTLTIQNDLSLATTPLSETVDVDAVSRPSPTRVNITLNEYGNAEINTIRLEKLAFTNVDSEMAMTIARNMADSIDRLVRNELDNATQTLYMDDDGSIDASDPTGTLGNATAKLFAIPPSQLRGASVAGRDGDLYVAYVHPDVSFDLRVETGETGWLKPHSYVDTANIYAGEIGTFVGCKFIETPRCAYASNRYTSYVVGRQALAEAVAVEPHVVVGPVVDKLKRFYPLGWHALMGWKIFRNEAIWKVYTNSSVASY
jgi:N4-gp56 family major capsid protein